MADLQSIVTSTLKKYGRKLHDQVFTATPFLFWMQQGGRIQPVDGGRSIVEPLEFGNNDTFDWRDPKATIDLREQDPFTYAEWDWKTIDGSIVVFWDDERKNRGESALFDYAKALISNAEKTLKKKMGAAVFADGSPVAELDGLAAAVAASGTYGGLSRTTYTWWQAQSDINVEAYTLNGGAAGGLRAMYDSCTAGGGDDEPDIIVTTNALWRKHVAILGPQQRFENAKLAEAGFRNLMHDNAPITWDANCPTGYMYVLNSKHLKLRPDSMCAHEFVKRERHPKDNQWATTILMLWVGNMVCTNPRMQGVMTGKS